MVSGVGTWMPHASGSPEAAAAKAARDVLVDMLPPQAASLDTAYRDYLTKVWWKTIPECVGIGVGLNVQLGRQAHLQFLATRHHDPEWRPRRQRSRRRCQAGPKLTFSQNVTALVCLGVAAELLRLSKALARRLVLHRCDRLVRHGWGASPFAALWYCWIEIEFDNGVRFWCARCIKSNRGAIHR
jgi:hypothetical protein